MRFKQRIIPILSLSALSLMVGCSSNENDQEPTRLHDSGSHAKWLATAEVHNPSNFERNDESIYFSFYDLGLSEQYNGPITFVRSGENLPSEVIDIDYDGVLDGVLVTTSMKASETFTLDARLTPSPELPNEKRTQAEISIKDGGRWQPHSRYPNSQFKEYVGGSFTNVDSIQPDTSYTDHSYFLRYEGPGIESDKVAYRVYLDWRNGFDIFGKLTPAPVLQTIGLDGYDSYHQPQDWGMDILKVGNSLGSGGFGLWYNDKVERITKTDRRGVTINANADNYASFTINYDGWQSPIGKQDIKAHLSMTAGSHLANVLLDLEQPVETMVAGIVKHKNTELMIGEMDITGKAYTYIASWGPQALDNAQLGMALFFRKEMLQEVISDEANYLAVLTPKGNIQPYNKSTQQLDYHFAALWQPESGIATKQAFKTYLDEQAERLTLKPRIRLTTKLSLSKKTQKLDADSALEWAVKLADSELKRKSFTYEYSGWDLNRRRLPKFEYDIVGLYPHTLNRLAEVTGEEKYQQAIHKITGSFIDDMGNIGRYKKSNYNIDNVAPGRAVLKLFELTKNEKYRKAADLIRQQLREHPKTSEGAFWHKKKYTSQLWLDGVYMGMPFLAEYSNLFEAGHSLDEVVKEFTLTYKHLRDPNSGNYYHGWDEKKQQDWADRKTGRSAEFWARGMGWLAMAIVDVLALIEPSEVELRAPLIKIAQELAVTLRQTQDETGTWWQIIDKPGETGNYRESSASAMFTYFLAEAVNMEVIDRSYLDMTKQAYEGLLDEFVLVHDNGEISITNLCYVAGLGFGRDGSYQYYMSEPVAKNDPKATVPFILASIAIYELLKD